MIAGAITTMRPQLCLPVAASAPRTAPARSTAGKPMGGWRLRQHHRRLSGRVRAGARRDGESGAGPDGLDRRGSADVPRHHVHGLWRRGKRRDRIGDTVAVFAQGPIGLCATVGAKLMGATPIIGVEPCRSGWRWRAARRRSRHQLQEARSGREIMRPRRARRGRGDRGARHAGDVRGCLRVLRPGGTLSSLGVYSSDLIVPLRHFAAGLGDHKSSRHYAPAGKSGCVAS